MSTHPPRSRALAPRVVQLVVAVVLAGCAAAPVPPAEYLLRPATLPVEAARPTSADLILGRVVIAPYLDRQGIVIETGERRIQAARGHRWAEPLTHSVRRLLQVGISRASGRQLADARTDSGTYPTTIDVVVHQLHGNVDGEVVIAADWQVRNTASGDVLVRDALQRTIRSRADGYPGLVTAHVELLEALADAIAASLTGQEDGL